MKKKLMFVLLALVIILAVLPVVRNTEKLEITDEVRAQAPGSFVNTPMGVVHYEMAGPADAQTVVLVHGGTVPYYLWDPTFAALKDAGFRVLRYDLFGRGYSDRPDAAYSNAFFEQQLLDLLQALDIAGPVDLVGVSMAGAIVAGFTDHHPQLVRRVVISDPFHEQMNIPLLGIPGVGDYIMTVYLEPALPKMQLDDFYRPERFPDWPERYRFQLQYKGFRRALLSTLLNFANEDKLPYFQALNKLDKPVLLIWGEEDKTVPYETHTRITQVLDAEFFPVPEAGHLPHLEQAEIVNPKIVSFLLEKNTP